jgi:hypothetical protein
VSHLFFSTASFYPCLSPLSLFCFKSRKQKRESRFCLLQGCVCEQVIHEYKSMHLDLLLRGITGLFCLNTFRQAAGSFCEAMDTNKCVRTLRHVIRQGLQVKDPVRTSHETHHVSATKTNRLMLFTATIMKHVNTLCVKNTAAPTNSQHRAQYVGEHNARISSCTCFYLYTEL